MIYAIVLAFEANCCDPPNNHLCQCGAGSSVAHHMLGSYQRAFLSILLAQFTRKRFSGGMCGVVRLATSSITVQVLMRTRPLNPNPGYVWWSAWPPPASPCRY